MRCIAILGWVLTASLLAGCGTSEKPLDRIDVSGKVTYNGQPIQKGDIIFSPDDGTKAPPTSAPIKEGAYATVQGAGVVPGTYTVRIQAYKEFASKELSPGGLDRPPGAASGEQILPAKFNSKSTQKATIDGKERPVVKDFDLKD